MHRASLRKKHSLNCSSSTPKRQFSLIKTILPCCKWTGEKQGVGFEEWERTRLDWGNASVKQKFGEWLIQFQTSKKCPLKEAKCKNHGCFWTLLNSHAIGHKPGNHARQFLMGETPSERLPLLTETLREHQGDGSWSCWQEKHNAAITS